MLAKVFEQGVNWDTITRNTCEKTCDWHSRLAVWRRRWAQIVHEGTFALHGTVVTVIEGHGNAKISGCDKSLG